jgi:hypothetical protein
MHLSYISEGHLLCPEPENAPCNGDKMTRNPLMYEMLPKIYSKFVWACSEVLKTHLPIKVLISTSFLTFTLFSLGNINKTVKSMQRI